ncbi:MAG TPA: glycosyltransferase family 87 protein [Saprospiraceae bacterium]|nr:glycosyltransferase family 87 protein [Saprospiraceae bacterium]HNT20879.1 glycosyltransferase family 87 protein [Saprospiraceae bacterium]
MNIYSTVQRKTLLLWAGVLLGLVSVYASWLKYQAPPRAFEGSPLQYTGYNNYVIFKQAFFHLLDHKDMYVLYPAEHHDLFKYSPGFAAAFGILAWLPDCIGLTVWNLLNFLVFFLALTRLSVPWAARIPLLLVFTFPELLTSLQNLQSNGLMTGLLIFAFIDFEKSNTGKAAVWIALAAFIKVYAGLAALFFLIYPGKVRFIIHGLLAVGVLFCLPLIWVPPAEMWAQYRGWWRILSQDHEASLGISILYLIHLVQPAFQSKTFIQVFGLGMILPALFPLRKFADVLSRINLLAFLFLTMVIYNHKSESATFILAVAGMGIWYFSKANPTRLQTAGIGLAFIFTVLSASDLFPANIRKNWFVPYGVKLWPCILIYLLVLKELILTGFRVQGAEEIRG